MSGVKGRAGRKKKYINETPEEYKQRQHTYNCRFYRKKKLAAKQMYEKQYENLFQKVEVNDNANK